MSASERLRELDGEATPGPWEARVYDHLRPGSSPLPMRSVYGHLRQNILRDEPSEPDANLIATLRTALPLIADVVEAAEKSVRVGAHGPLGAALTALRNALKRE